MVCAMDTLKIQYSDKKNQVRFIQIIYVSTSLGFSNNMLLFFDQLIIEL